MTQYFQVVQYISKTFNTINIIHGWLESLENELCSFSKLSIASPTSQFVLQPVALPTSQLILQPFRTFTYITVHSPTLLSLLLHHRLFTYVTWRAAHDIIAQTFNLTYRCSILLCSLKYCAIILTMWGRL